MATIGGSAAARGEAVQVEHIRLTQGVESTWVVNQLKVHPLSKVMVSDVVNLCHPYNKALQHRVFSLISPRGGGGGAPTVQPGPSRPGASSDRSWGDGQTPATPGGERGGHRGRGEASGAGRGKAVQADPRLKAPSFNLSLCNG